MSTCPARSGSAATSSRFARSAARASALRSSPASSSSASCLRAVSSRWAPCSSSAFAIPRPRPPVAPVSRTREPEIFTRSEYAAYEQRPPRRLRLGREAKRLVEAQRIAVLLVDVELHAPAPARTRGLERRLDELTAVPAAARRLGHEQVLEPTVVHAGPDAQAVAELADPNRAVVVAEGEQELGAIVLEQPRSGYSDALLAWVMLSPPVAEFCYQPDDVVQILSSADANQRSDATGQPALADRRASAKASS